MWTEGTINNHAGYDGGELLVQRREQMGLTQEELARRSGISVRTISDLERGRTRRPHPRSIQLLATALNLDQADVAYLLDVRRDRRWSRFPITIAGIRSPQADSVVPRQIPMAARHFAGRDCELHTLSALLSENAQTAVLTLIYGPAGMGKTTLAVHWAHQVADYFPDGQLYMDLRGSSAATAIAPSQAIRNFLDAFHIPPGRIPAGLDAQAALYRSLLAGKRVLIVLDNAWDAEQVVPLLPGSPGCVGVVASRNRITSLIASHGARPVPLDALSPRDARLALSLLLGPGRVAAEEEAAAQLIERCHRSPLMLSTVAAHAAVHPALPLSAVVKQMPELAPGAAAIGPAHAGSGVDDPLTGLQRTAITPS
jgi:transcriptional regulator with XRE-family HTH domain